MKIIIAPDSFKESVSASRCAQAMTLGAALRARMGLTP